MAVIRFAGRALRLLLRCAAVVLVLALPAALAFHLYVRTTYESLSLPDDDEWPPFQHTDADLSWLQAAAATATQQTSAPIAGDAVRGNLFANEPGNLTGDGLEISGFRTFVADRYPHRNLFWCAGWNFEHIFSGLQEDTALNRYAPRLDPCLLIPRSDHCASLFWPAEASRWGLTSEMTYNATGPCVDIEFKVTPVHPLSRDVIVFMWASYLQGVRGPKIHFWGMNLSVNRWVGSSYGRIGWTEYGFQSQSGGTVGCLGVPGLPVPARDRDSGCINIENTRDCRFLLPFYYGLVDGDGDPVTSDDDMAFIMMFDQAEMIRFGVWNINPAGDRPAWDWHFMIHEPRVGETYGYRARAIYKPFVSVEDVVQEYTRWRKSLGTPARALALAVDPEGQGEVFPADTAGMYASDSLVYFGVIPRPGWRFDHWEGPVACPKNRFTRVRMDADVAATAVLVPTRRGAEGASPAAGERR